HPEIERLDIYADRLIVRAPLHMPRTEVHIYADEVRFEDADGQRGVIDTTPIDPPDAAAQFMPGADGEPGGDIFVFARSFSSQSEYGPRFIMNGGHGQQGGEGQAGTNGVPGQLLDVSHHDLVACGQVHLSGPVAPASPGDPIRFRLTDPVITPTQLVQNTVD